MAPNVGTRYTTAAEAYEALKPLKATATSTDFIPPISIPWKLVGVSMVGAILGTAIGIVAHSHFPPAKEIVEDTNISNISEAVEWYKKGRKLAVTKEYQEALKTFDRAIALRPKYAEAWANRCWALTNLGEYEEGLVSCDRALDITPNYAWAMGYRALALLELKRPSEAILTLDRRLEIQSRHSWSWVLRGRAQIKLKQYQEASTFEWRCRDRRLP